MEELYDIFEERDIDPAHWNEMIETLDAGGLLDADSGAEPVSVEVEDVGYRQVETRTFADHSVSVVEVDGSEATEEVEGPAPAVFGTERCYADVGGDPATITGCRLYYNGISFSYSFRVDSSHRAPNLHVFTAARGGTVHRAIGHGVSLLDTGQMFATDPRMARFNFTITPAYVGSTRTVWLQGSMNASTGSISVSTNL